MAWRSTHHNPATILFSAESGEPVTANGYLIADPHYTSHNRIELIGNKNDEIKFMSLFNNQSLKWSLCKNEAWHADLDKKYHAEHTGICRPLRLGMTRGKNISDQSIQVYAELQVIEERIVSPALERSEPSATYWFCPQPANWGPYNPRLSTHSAPLTVGAWRKPRSATFKYRKLSYEQQTHDERIFELPFIENISGLEIHLNRDTESHEIEESSQKAFDWIQLALMFLYIQEIDLFRTELCDDENYIRIMQPTRKAKRSLDIDYYDFRPRFNSEKFISLLSSKMSEGKFKEELIHASVFQYMNSFQSPSIEGALVDSVEAIEYLLAAFEDAKGLDRRAVPRPTWRRLGPKLRKIVKEDTGIEQNERETIIARLKPEPLMSLESRMIRVIKLNSRKWTKEALKVTEYIGELCAARNRIVHGLGDVDTNHAYINLMRSRYVFEKLICNFVGYPSREGHSPWWLTNDGTPIPPSLPASPPERR